MLLRTRVLLVKALHATDALSSLGFSRLHPNLQSVQHCRRGQALRPFSLEDSSANQVAPPPWSLRAPHCRQSIPSNACSGETFLPFQEVSVGSFARQNASVPLSEQRIGLRVALIVPHVIDPPTVASSTNVVAAVQCAMKVRLCGAHHSCTLVGIAVSTLP